MDSVSVDLHASDQGSVFVHLKVAKPQPVPESVSAVQDQEAQVAVVEDDSVRHPEKDAYSNRDGLDVPGLASEGSQHDAGHAMSSPTVQPEPVQDSTVMDKSQSAFLTQHQKDHKLCSF